MTSMSCVMGGTPCSATACAPKTNHLARRRRATCWSARSAATTLGCFEPAELRAEREEVFEVLRFFVGIASPHHSPGVEERLHDAEQSGSPPARASRAHSAECR